MRATYYIESKNPIAWVAANAITDPDQLTSCGMSQEEEMPWHKRFKGDLSDLRYAGVRLVVNAYDSEPTMRVDVIDDVFQLNYLLEKFKTKWYAIVPVDTLNKVCEEVADLDRVHTNLGLNKRLETVDDFD